MKRATAIGLGMMLMTAWGWAEPAAVVLKYSGEVNYRLATTSAWARVEQTNLALDVGAEIGTTTNAEAILKLGGTQLVTIRELTWLRINRASEDDSQVSFGIGKVLLNVTKKTEKTSCRVVTPSAIAAVRGTVFGVETDVHKTTLVTVGDGQVDVTGQVPNSRTVTVDKGQMVLVVFNQPPQDPRPAQMKLLEEMKGFRENLENLALLGGGLGAAATQIAEENMRELQEAGKMLEEQRLQRKGAEVIREDFQALKEAFLKCVADTGYVPQQSDRNFDEENSQLKLLLIDGQTADGQPIPGWKGPYLEGNLKDPFGRFYKVRYKDDDPLGPRFEIYSLGLKPEDMNDDPVPVILSYRRLKGPDGKPPAEPGK